MPDYSEIKGEDESGEESNISREISIHKGLKTGVVEKNCKTCNSEHRHAIDRMLAMGTSYSEIERIFNIDRRSISNHDRKHLNYQNAAIRRIIEKEAKNVEQNIEEGVSGVVKRRTYLESALHKGLEALAEGNLDVEPKDVLAIIQQLESMDEKNESAGIAVLQVQFRAYVQAMKDIVPSEYWEQIVARTKEVLAEADMEMATGLEPKQLLQGKE